MSPIDDATVFSHILCNMYFSDPKGYFKTVHISFNGLINGQLFIKYSLFKVNFMINDESIIDQFYSTDHREFLQMHNANSL